MSSSYTPSAPPMPDNNYNNNYPPPPPQPQPSQAYHISHQAHNPPSNEGYNSNFNYTHTHNYNPFPPGTDPEIIRSFQMVDRDQSGFIDDSELLLSLSSSYHKFNLRTVRLLMFLFKNPNESSLRIGPNEFAALWSCLGQWRAIFDRFDRDRSGKIDVTELRDALYSLGYAVPPSVLQLLISHYDTGKGGKVELDFDSFVECGVVIKGLTDKFKEKDSGYTGSATLPYDSFMTMVLPFLVTYN